MDASKENIRSSANRSDAESQHLKPSKQGSKYFSLTDVNNILQSDLPPPPAGSTVIFDKSGSVTVVNKATAAARVLSARPPKVPPSAIFSTSNKAAIGSESRAKHDDDESQIVSSSASRGLSKKHKDVPSSGYGRINVKRTNSSPSLHQAGDEHSETSIGGSTRSASAGRTRTFDGTLSSSHTRSHSADPAKRLANNNSSSGLPSNKLFGTPVGEITLPRLPETSNSQSWAQKQRELQHQRLERAGQISSGSVNQRLGYDSDSAIEIERSSAVGAMNKLKRSAMSANISTMETPDFREANKSRKASEGSTPASSVASIYHYNGLNAHCEESDVEDDRTMHVDVDVPKRDILAPLSPKGKKKHQNVVEGSTTPIQLKKRNNLRPSPSSSITKGGSGRKNRLGATACKSPILLRQDRFRSSPALADQSEIQTIAGVLFAPGTGLADEEIRKLLNSRGSSAKNWELKKKLEASTETIKTLKETMNSLLQAKNRLCKVSIETEMTVRKDFMRASHRIQTLDNECSMLKSKIQHMEETTYTFKDNVKGAKREINIKEERIKALEAEIAPLKEALLAAERKHTEVSFALALAEGRSEEAAKQAENWRSEIAFIEAKREEAVKRAETAVAASMEKELKELRHECILLRTRMEAREQELTALIEAEGINPENPSGTQISVIKKELDRLRDRAKEAESELVHCAAELERALADRDAVSARTSEKDKSMNDLMKSIGDIQKSSQSREDEANESRKAAERRVSELEKQLVEANGEIALLKHERSTLKEALEIARQELEEAEQLIDIIKDELSEQRAESSSHTAQLQLEKELRARAEAKELEERRERIALSAQMLAMTKEHAQVEAQLKEANETIYRKWNEKVEDEKQRSIELQKLLSEAKETITGLEAEKSTLKGALTEHETTADSRVFEENGRLRGEINVLKERLIEAERRSQTFGAATAEQVSALEAQLREGQIERRRMHNIIQELRGNVRVFARIRPFLPSDGASDDAEPCAVPRNDTELKVTCPTDGKLYNFAFDRVFAPSVGQEFIFQEVSEFVQSALDGYNVCLFSYGQTSSGKTHTMQGSGNGAMRGIIPRAIEQVARYKESLEKEGWKYAMNVSFLEIYNENIRDLLRDEKNLDLKHEVKMATDGTRYVTDLTMTSLDPADQNAVEDILTLAAKHRSVAATDMNAVSSRSHSVFTLHLSAVHVEERQSLRGTLNLVDLAGSERLERSGAVGDRAKEAMAINKSLSSLTDVFVAIGKKASHIPFRNSKLTYLLQPSLSGDGKTLMIANISPTEHSVQETLCTLRFAAQVNKCELGKAKRSISELSGDGTDALSVKRPVIGRRR